VPDPLVGVAVVVVGSAPVDDPPVGPVVLELVGLSVLSFFSGPHPASVTASAAA